MKCKEVVAVLSAACCLTGCAGGEQRADDAAAPDSPNYGGTVVVAYLAEASSMNHLTSVDENSLELQDFVLFTTLIQYDAELNPVPYLAERWDTSSADAGLALTFYLRDDVKWHDGMPTTARDVKFTFDRIKNPAAAYPRASLFTNYDSASVSDNFVITFYLKRHAGFMDPWRTVAPMPEHILGEVAVGDLPQHPFGTTSPVGNGPFRFIEHRARDRWVFEANPDFPQPLGGRPFVDRLVYRVIEEPTTRLGELLAGEVDVYVSVDPSQIAEIDAHPAARVTSFPSRSYTFINWNSQRPLFRDARVRRALTLGIDRQRLVEAVRYGLGTVANGPVPPFHWAYHAHLNALPYDPDSARALLDAAGWADRDGDGVREREADKASFELRTNPNPARQDIMTLVQADLAKIGVQVRTFVQEAQSLRMDITSKERRFDAFVLGWSSDFVLDDRALFACSQRDGPFQWASYCNRRVDALLDRITSLADRSAALPLWYEYQEIIQQDQPYTFLYYLEQANGVNRRVQNVRMDIRGNLINAKDWWILPATGRAAKEKT